MIITETTIKVVEMENIKWLKVRKRNKKMKARNLKIYAVKVQWFTDREGGKEISRKQIGTARFGLRENENEISKWKARQLYKAMEKAYLKYKGMTVKPGGGKSILIIDELGRVIRSNQYCWSYRFEEPNWGWVK